MTKRIATLEWEEKDTTMNIHPTTFYDPRESIHAADSNQAPLAAALGAPDFLMAAPVSNSQVFRIPIELWLDPVNSKIRVRLRTATGDQLRAHLRTEELDRILSKDRFVAIQFPDAGECWHSL